MVCTLFFAGDCIFSHLYVRMFGLKNYFQGKKPCIYCKVRSRKPLLSPRNGTISRGGGIFFTFPQIDEIRNKP